MIRKILIPVRGDGKGDNVLAHAAALAQRFKAHVEIIHCRARPEDMIPYGVPIPAFLKKQIIEQASGVADQEEAGLKDEVHVLAKTLKLRMTEKPTGKSASASWIEEAGRQVDVIKRHGRLADIICVAQPDVDRNLGENTLKTALFNTGRPVMMCPPTKKAPTNIGEKITIAWNGSTEAARAVALTLNLLAKAKEITILTTGLEIHGASSDDLKKYLAEREIKAEIKRFKPNGSSIGAQLLKQSKACSADIMIMGAYGDSHERETIFGGNTQYVVDNATMPIVLVH